MPRLLAISLPGLVRVNPVAADPSIFENVEPYYEEFPGWKASTSEARTWQDLPENARNYVLALEKLSGTRFSAIGVGPDRDQTIVVHDLIND